MRYFFGHKLNVLPSAQVLSEPVIIKTLSETATLKVTGGAQLVVNYITIGSEATVTSGDEVRVRVNAPAQLERVAFYEVYQGLDLAGIFTVSSQQEPALVRDEDYIGVPLYEVLPKDTWTLTGDAYLGMVINGRYSEIELLPKSLSGLPQNRIHIIDFHRSLLYVVDAETGDYKGSVTLAKKPVSEQVIHTGGLRTGTAILNNDGTADIYDNFYALTKTVSLTTTLNVIQPRDKGFYSVNGTTVYEHTSPNFAPVSYYAGEDEIVSFVSSPLDDTLIVATETELHVISEGAVAKTIPLPAKAFSLEYLEDKVYVSGGTTGNFHLVDLSDDSVTTFDLGGNITYSTRLVNTSKLWVSDYDRNLLIDFSGFNNKKQYEMNFQPIGIIAAMGNVFSPMLYTNLPRRFVETDITPDVITLEPIDAELNAQVSTSFTVTDISENIKVSAPIGLHKMTANGNAVVDVPDETEITLGFTAREVFYDSLQMPVVYGDKIAYITINPPAPDAIPDDFYFQPVSNADKGVEVCSAPTIVSGLGEGVETELIVTGGTLKLNDVETETPVNIKDGDSVVLCGTSAESDFTTTLVTASILELDVYFAITTYSPKSDLTTSPVVSLEPRLFEGVSSAVVSELFDLPIHELYESSLTIRIPNVYDAFMQRNGANIGQEFNYFSSNDTDFNITSSTGRYPGKYYPLPVITDGGSDLWLIRALPAVRVHNFTFGEHESDHMTYPVTSDTVIVGGIPADTPVPMVVPVGIKVFVNGEDVSDKAVDRYGYPTRFTRVPVYLGDEITLETIPNGIYGEMLTYIISIGFTEGQFRIITPDADPMVWLPDFIRELTMYSLTAVNSSYTSTLAAYTPERNSIESLTLTSGQDISSNIFAANTVIVGGEDLPELSYSNLSNSSDHDDSVVTDYSTIRYGIFDEFVPASYKVVYADNVITSDVYYNQQEVLSVNEDVSWVNATPNQVTFADGGATLVPNTLNVFHSLVDWKHVIHYGQSQVDTPIFGAEANRLQSIEYLEIPDLEFICDSTTSSVAYSLTGTSAYLLSLVHGIDRDLLGYSYGNDSFRPHYVEENYAVSIGESTNIIQDIMPFDLYSNEVNAYLFTEHGAIPQYINSSIPEDLLEFEVINSYDLLNIDAVGSIMTYYDTAVVDIDPAIKYSLDRYVEVDQLVSLPIHSTMKYGEGDTPLKSADQSKVYVDDNFITTREPYSLLSATYSVVVEGLYPPSVDKSGYFASRTEAESDARSAGYEDGEFTAIYVEGKGWAWNIPFSCTNMCSAECPPAGYLQGG